jgi:hypothetical protein
VRPGIIGIESSTGIVHWHESLDFMSLNSIITKQRQWLGAPIENHESEDS